MAHEIYRVVSFEKVTPFTLASSLRRRCLSGHRVPPSTEGKPNSPLQDPSLFDQVQIDPEVHTLVWPNGADFNPQRVFTTGPSQVPHSRLWRKSGYLRTRARQEHD